MRVIESELGEGFKVSFTIPEEFWSLNQKLPPANQQATVKMLEEIVGMFGGILGADLLMDLRMLLGIGPSLSVERAIAKQRGEEYFALPRLHAALSAHINEMGGTETKDKQRH